MSLYDELGVTPDATPDEIAKAHRALVKLHHPDKDGDRASFDRVQRAATILRDPEKRARYDRTGNADDEPDNDLAKLTEILVSTFDEAMSREGWEYRDVIADMDRILKRRIAELKRQIARVEEAAATEKRALERLKFNGKGRDPITMVLTQRIDGKHAAVAAGKLDVEVHDRALAMIGNYRWKVDERDPQERWTSVIDEDAFREAVLGRRSGSTGRFYKNSPA